ncbi:hypothetical protein POTOM_049786 [Populus tomentosa]|uniref:DUF7610 domain-containing protein n=2 Tax=Populus TaxID=3689 RepID=A0A4U5QAT2_POPAL|nr:hypothetical protein POTOM_049786 [Populus tomentosa]TKS07132.1 hypothetical protein D5086_0000114640 [Populus alba]
MAKQSSMLQKKLRELEHELINKVFSLPAETQLSELYIQDVEQRFFFLKNLLSAETTSSSKRPQYRLQQIGKRLSDLETAFYDRNNNNKTATTQVQLENVSCSASCLDDDGDQTANETGLCEFEESGNAFQSLMKEATPLTVTTQDQLGIVPSTESCLDEDGDQTSEETGSFEFEEAENAFQSLIEEKTPSMKTEMVKVLVKKRSGRVFWGMASGVVIAMALVGFMTESSSGIFPHLKHSVCLPPT